MITPGGLCARVAKLAQTILLLALACAGVAALGFVLIRPFTALGDYDSMLNAAIPKNFALGRGYLTTYPPVQGYRDVDPNQAERWFNVEVTSGPGLMFPAAGLMRAFGAQYWVPGFTTAALSVILAVAAVVLLSAGFPPCESNVLPRPGVAPGLSRRAAAVSVAMLLLTAFTAHLYWPGTDTGFLRHWYELMGDVPAGLATVLGALVLWSGPPNWRRLCAGGVLLAWAYLIKTAAVIGNLVVMGTFVCWLATRVEPIKLRLARGATLFASVALPGGLFAIYRRIALGARYDEWREADRVLFASVGSGVEQLASAPDAVTYLIASFLRHGKTLIAAFAAWQWTLATIVLLWLGWTAARQARDEPRKWRDRSGTAPAPHVMLGACLLGAFTMHAGWWMLMEYQGWTRRMVQALVYLSFAFAALTAGLRRSRTRMAALGVALALALPNLRRLVEVFPRLSSKEPNLAAALETATFLEREKARGAILLGCGWAMSRELEYIVSGTNNFHDCLRMPDGARDRRLLLVRNGYWDVFATSRLQAFAIRCEPLLLDRPPYKVAHCPTGEGISPTR